MRTYVLDPASSVPLYEQLYRRLKEDLLSGAIAGGEKLPSKRALAENLNVSRITVENAYQQLLTEGYLVSKPRSGYYAEHLETLPQVTAPGIRPDAAPHGAPEAAVSAGQFPFSVWARLMRGVLLDGREALLRPVPSEGLPALREAIAGMLLRSRGMEVDPASIVIGAGAEYLYTLLFQLLGRENIFALENPGHRKLRQVYTANGASLMPVALDESGVTLQSLLASGANVLHISPGNQFPTGIVMPIGRRTELLRWASSADDRYLVEDDYDSEFRYKGKPIPALQGYDAEGRVIYIGTFSKSIAPAIRMSYMVMPESVCEMYHRRCGFINSTVSKVDQMILQKFIEDGHYERHLNKMRALYRNRHDILLAELKEMGTDFSISGENAGVHLLLHFGSGRTEEEMIRLAAANGVRVYGLSEYYVDGASPSENAVILLGYANMDEKKIKEAVHLLKKAWYGNA